MNIKLASAFLALGILKGEMLAKVASDALEAGIYSESLAELASVANTTLRDHEGLFIKSLNELNIKLMVPQDAALLISRDHASKIISGDVTPYNGAKSISSDIAYNIEPVPPEIEVFIALEDQYADFSDSVRLDYYGEEYCNKVRKEMELEIIKAANILVSKSA
jgi:hypothetical protein